MSHGQPPAYPPLPPPQRPRGGLPTGAQIAIGAVVGPVVYGAAYAAITTVGSLVMGPHSYDETTPREVVGNAIILGGFVLLFALWVAGVIWSRTRWYAVGLVIGVAVLSIVAAGACVVLLGVLFVGLSQSG